MDLQKVLQGNRYVLEDLLPKREIKRVFGRGCRQNLNQYTFPCEVPSPRRGKTSVIKGYYDLQKFI